jgi:hypothetical protein
MITKIDDCEIKHQHSIKVLFLDCDNLIKSEVKPIIKLNL